MISIITDRNCSVQIVDEVVKGMDKEVPYNIDDPAARRTLIGHILHSADIGAQTQERSVALKWTQGLVAEFSMQARREHELGIPVTPFMSGLDDELKQMQLQAGFIENIVLPLWSALAKCFPAIAPAVAQAEANKSYYRTRIEELQGSGSS